MGASVYDNVKYKLIIAINRYKIYNKYLVKTFRCLTMVDVAQLAEHRIVAPVVAGSIPVFHPFLSGA